ncbi:MAG TPA: hypothetical protein VFG18_03890 [Xanthomonadaceae bacterium]|nr:hypothetical protein [Xanthomonadaceae bacterium]
MPGLRPLRPVLAALLLLAAGSACAQVRHCVTADGADVYTDKRCEELDAVPAPPPPALPGPGATRRRPACARTLRDLSFELQAAIDAQDVNRLAASYDWAGMSTRAGFAVLDRLAAIARRPLIDIVPLYAGVDEGLLAEDPGQPPLALRLEQTLDGSATPAPTVLSLRRTLGCWWVRF